MSNAVVVTVTREQAVAVLEALGVTTAKKLTVERIAKKLSNLKTLVEKAGANLSAQPPEVLAIIQDVAHGVSVELKAEKRVKKEKAPEPEPEKPSEKAMRLTDGGKKEPKEKKPAAKKEKAPAAPRFTRAASLILSFSKVPSSLESLMEKADKMYTTKTGSESNPRETRWVAGIVLSALRAANLITENENGNVARNF